ncbi:MAG: hypothetical protein GXO22_07265 [Aquificae bacterium]|nr:hypothetical protein [Aquificota bacterium]
MAVIDKDFKITKKEDSKKIINDIKSLLESMGIKDNYDIDIKDITEKDTFIKPLYSLTIDIKKKVPEKKRVLIMDTVYNYLEENYGYNFTVDVITD